jgi:hypothetical protein
MRCCLNCRGDNCDLFWHGWDKERWAAHFPHWSPDDFLDHLHANGLPDRCEDPATLAALAAIVTDPPPEPALVS